MNVIHELGNSWVYPVLLAEETLASEAVLVAGHDDLIYVPSWHHKRLHVLVQLVGDGEPVNEYSLAEVADGVCWEDLSYASLWIISLWHLRKPIIVVIVVGNDTTFDYGLIPADPPSASTFCLGENETYSNRYDK